MGKIILASSSPRRRDLMKKTKYNFEIIPSPYEEDHTRTDFSYEFIENLAQNKAMAVIPLVKEPALIIGADTVVVLNGKILGKPESKEHACKMLRSLSGKTHSVVTSIVVVDSETKKIQKKSVTSYVEFENLTDEQIKNYVEKFMPLDKAGSYGIQEMPKGYIKSYTGRLENIIGLDTETLSNILKQENRE